MPHFRYLPVSDDGSWCTLVQTLCNSQYLLTKLGHQTLPAPGAFDGYTLVGTAFLGTGSTRLLLSVYNSNPGVLGASYPPLLVVHSDTNSEGSGGALLRVMELYKSADSPLGDAMGVAVTYSTDGNILVSHVDGEAAAVTAFSKTTVRSLASPPEAGRAAIVLLAAVQQGAVLSYPLGVLPLGGISFFADNGDCSMLAADGSVNEASATVYVFAMFNCDWFLPSMLNQQGVLKSTTSFHSGGNVTGLVVFRHSTDTLLYAAVTRCGIVRGMDCRIEFSGMNVTGSVVSLVAPSWTFNRTVLHTLVVPAGTVGLAFDPDTGGTGFSSPRGPQFILGCSGAAQANLMRVKSAGKFVEGRIMVLDKPIFISVPFGVKRNIAFATFLGFDVLARRCALPLSEPCAPCDAPPCPEPPPKEDKKSGSNSKKKRALQVVTPFGHGTGRYLADSSGCLSFEKELFRREAPIFSKMGVMLVVVVPIDYYFEAVFLGTVSFRAQLCIPNQQISMALVPEGAVLAKAGAAVNLLVVRAGLELSTTILKLTLVPKLTLNIGRGGSVQACFDAKIEIRPLKLEVRVLYRVLSSFPVSVQSVHNKVRPGVTKCGYLCHLPIPWAGIRLVPNLDLLGLHQGVLLFGLLQSSNAGESVQVPPPISGSTKC